MQYLDCLKMILFSQQRLTGCRAGWSDGIRRFRKLRILPLLQVILATWIFPPAGVSGQAEDRAIAIEEVDIVSDRLGLPEARTGRHTTVITGEDILKLPVNSLDELLRFIPFLETQARGGFGVQSDILLRGGTFNQVLILLDGMRVNDPLTGHFNSYIPVPLSEISRIEVYRGPASSLYGPDAVGGVINIITKTFLAGPGEDRIEGRLEGWYGQHNLIRSNSGLTVRKGRFRTGAGISLNRSDGHPLSADTLHGDFNIGILSVSIAFDASENIQMGIRTAYDSRLFNAQYFYTNSPFDLSREQVTKLWNQAFVRFRLNDFNTLTFQAGYETTADSFLFSPGFPANTHRSHYHNYQVNHLYITPGGFRLTSGVQADLKRIFSSDRGDHNNWHSGIYSMLSRNVSRNATLSGGFRIDHDPGYGLEVLPQVNAAWSVKTWNIRGSVGRSIRAPDFTELYVSTGLPGPLSAGRNLGNPDLLAEKAWSIEAGVDKSFNSGIQVKSTLFYRFSRDLIDYTVTPAGEIENNSNLIPGESYFWASNIGLLNTWGMEVQLKGYHELKGGLVFDWELAFQALESNNEEGLVSKYLSTHAKKLLNGRVGLSNESFSLHVTSLYKNRDAAEEEAIDESLKRNYALAGLRADKYFLDTKLVLSLQANNLFDLSYADVLGARMPGRWISGGVTWNFNR